MAPLKTGTCATCSTEEVKLRPNPFTEDEQCEECRNSEIIGITEVRKKHGLKDEDLEGLQMKTEAQLAFIGGPPRRWYLVKEIEERKEEVTQREKNDPPKRGRGRPKKSDAATSTNAKATTAKATVAADKQELKRKRSAKADDTDKAGKREADDDGEDENGEDDGEDDGGKGNSGDGGNTKAAAKTKPKPKSKAKAAAKPEAEAAEDAPPKKKRGRPAGWRKSQQGTPEA